MPDRRLEAPALPEPVDVDGSWQVVFPPALGAPESAVFDKLVSWPDRRRTASDYSPARRRIRRIRGGREALFGKGREIVLDLGVSRVIARGGLNGRTCDAVEAAVRGERRRHCETRREPDRACAVTSLWPNG
jgi:hypothetical protein